MNHNFVWISAEQKYRCQNCGFEQRLCSRSENRGAMRKAGTIHFWELVDRFNIVHRRTPEDCDNGGEPVIARKPSNGKSLR
jgi:hypothetical protein